MPVQTRSSKKKNALVTKKKESSFTKKASSKKKTVRWRDIAPMTTADRKKMDQENPRCFLDHSDPSRPKYPICPRGSTKPTHQGIEAARKRAILQRNTKIRLKASNLDKPFHSVNIPVRAR